MYVSSIDEGFGIPLIEASNLKFHMLRYSNFYEIAHDLFYILKKNEINLFERMKELLNKELSSKLVTKGIKE